MTDRSGNTGSSSVDVVVNTVTPVIGINTLAADDVINAAEKGEDLLLSGTSNQPEGTTITVNLNGINYSATTDASGNWSVTVPASAVSALGEANYTVTASVTDNVGNSAAAARCAGGQLVAGCYPQQLCGRQYRQRGGSGRRANPDRKGFKRGIG